MLWRQNFSSLVASLGLAGFRSPLYTYVLSQSGPIQAGAEKLGICGSVRGRLGTLRSGTLARLLVNDLPVRVGDGIRSMAKNENVKRIKREEKATLAVFQHNIQTAGTYITATACCSSSN